MAETLGALGSEAAWIVHGQGLDELTVAGENQVVELRDGSDRPRFTVTPEDAGLPRAPIEAIAGGDAAFNAASLAALLEGAHGPYRDTVVLNAAAALVVAGRAGDLREGAGIAADSIASGAALAALQALRRETSLGESAADLIGGTGRADRLGATGAATLALADTIAPETSGAGMPTGRRGERMPNDTTTPPDVLARICADTLAEVARRKAERSIERLRSDIAARADTPRGFGRALKRAVAAGRYGLVAEIKKASPSGGLIRPDFDPPALAQAYRDGGATCLSVLTDGPHFQGSPDASVRRPRRRGSAGAAQGLHPRSLAGLREQGDGG